MRLGATIRTILGSFCFETALLRTFWNFHEQVKMHHYWVVNTKMYKACRVANSGV